MKRVRITFLIAVAAIAISCKKKDRSCECIETYTGAQTSYTNVTDTLYIDIEEEEAITECNKGDKAVQTLFTESYGIECELKKK